MRKWLVMLTLGFSLSGFAQTFGEIGTVWRAKEVSTNVAVGGNTSQGHENKCYNYVADTIVGNDTLQIIDFYQATRYFWWGSFGDWTNMYDSTAYVKYDSSQVYYGGLNSLKLYYDFNLETGDSLFKHVKFYVGGNEIVTKDTLQVVSVDSVLYNGWYRKRITFDTLFYLVDTTWTNLYEYLPPMVWIEGVGDVTLGTFSSALEDTIKIADTWGPVYSMKCFVENDTTWIGDCDPFYACNWITTGFSELTADQFKLYPNPVEDLLKLEVTFNDGFDLFLTDIKGRKIQYYENLMGNQQLDVSDLVSGIYLIHISDGESKITQKMIKL